jgi:hypothetical protein
MSEDTEFTDSEVDQAQVSFEAVRVRGTITAPYSEGRMEHMIAIQIAKRIQIPLAETAAVTCIALFVSAVLVGVIVLTIPFGIAFVYSIYAIYALRVSTEEKKPMLDYAVLTEPRLQSEVRSASAGPLTETRVDSNDEEQSENPEDA